MEKECKTDQMAADMKENGWKIKPMAKANLYMLMGMYMREIGLMIKLMDKVHILTLMVLNMLENGMMIDSMGIYLSIKN